MDFVEFAYYGFVGILIVDPNLKMLAGNNRAILYLGGLLLAYLVAGLIIFRQETKVGENAIAKWKLILFGMDHVTHHRGQMVVYLRLNGIKPPQYRSGYFG